MATAELAVLLPALALLLTLGLRALSVGADRVACADAARAAARLAARGEAAVVVEAAARRLAPRGARVSWTRGADDVSVVVSDRAALLPGIGLPVRGQAVARLEPGA